MSNLGDLYKADGTAIDRFGGMIGTIADIAGAISGVIAVIDLLDSLMLDGETAQSETLAILDQLGAEDIRNRLTSLHFQLAPALGVMDGLKADLSANLTPGERTAKIDICSAALEALSDTTPDSVWYAPYAEQLHWTDYPDFIYEGNSYPIDVGYNLVAPTPDSTGNVFSYIYVLPLYLQALGIWLTVAGSLDQAFVAHYGNPVLTNAVTVLGEFHDKIVAEGITPLAPMRGTDRGEFPWNASTLWETAFDLKNIDNPDEPIVWPRGITPLPERPGTTEPSGVSIEYGTVDRFSGASAMATYALMFDYSDWPNAPAPTSALSPASTDMSLYNKFLLRSMYRSLLVYREVGLLGTWKAINAVRRILGLAPQSRPNHGDWSFRTIANLLGLTSLKDISAFIQSTPPADTPASQHPGFRTLLEV